MSAAAWHWLLSLWFFTSEMYYSYYFSCTKLHAISEPVSLVIVVSALVFVLFMVLLNCNVCS